MESTPIKLLDIPVVDFDKDLPAEETAAFFEQSSDRAMGIMWAAIVENHLTNYIRLIMYRKDKQVADELFKPTGPLGAFGTKIKLAYLLRIIDPITYRDYIYVSKIRNAFAHDLSKTGFDDQQIAAWINNMNIYSIVRAQSEGARQRLAENLYPIDPDANIPKQGRTLSPSGFDKIVSQFLDSNRSAYRQCLRYMIHQIVYREKQLLGTEKALNDEEQLKGETLP